ncbi:C2H2 finger domain-containing protein [Rutstroemia sp. NJR-2017a BBW]|nr:C2H2 finger domain-containing protein [Rutstroemia sp. NJR-2017a BBW]
MNIFVIGPGKLVKKHRLTTKKHDNTAIYIEDLTNLTTTKQSRYRIETSLFGQLDIFSGNRPSALLSLRYSDIVVNLLRDPNSGPYRILIEFIYEFIKKYLGIKDSEVIAYIEVSNTFPLPEVILDPSLVLSPYVALLGLIFTDNIFLALSLILVERISELDIPPGYEQLPLHLKPEMANIPVFRKSIRTPYSWQISPDEQLLYTTLLKWIKRLGVLTGFPQITCPYCLRYSAGNAFNQSGLYPMPPFS